jgi:hypothetical protein
MVRVQNRAGGRQVERILGLRAPRQRHEPLEVGARHRILGSRGRHPGESLELPERLFLGFLRHPGRFDLLAELVGLLGTLIRLAELFLNGLELLPEVVVALALAHLGFDLGLDAGAELQHLGLLGQRRHQAREPRLDVGGGEQLLLRLRRERGQ